MLWQPRTESFRRPERDRPRAAKPESVTEHLPRSKERSLTQLPARLVRLENKNVTFWIGSELKAPGVCYEVATAQVEVAELVAECRHLKI